MKLAFSHEMKDIDATAAAKFNLPSEVLMESAGQMAVQEILNHITPKTKDAILILVGPGNNGGDALVVSRLLFGMGFSNQHLFLVSGMPQNNPLFEKQLERVQNLKINILSNLKDLSAYSLIIDGIFGIGLNKNIEGPLSDLINSVNRAEAIKVSLDVPSGLNADTGKIMGNAVKSHLTITFGLAKPGFYIEEGSSYCGKLLVTNIGFPQALIEEKAKSVQLFEAIDAKSLLKKESPTTNKSRRGKVLIIAGGDNFWGAGLLSCKAALRSGAGYVYWTSFTNPIFNLPEQPELIAQPLDHITDFSVYDSIVLGPGLGVSENTYKTIFKINNDNVLIDADGLNSLAKYGIKQLNPKWVITPHTGELARILNSSTEAIENNKFEAISKAQSTLKCNVLLKGLHTIVKSDKFQIINSGNKALAKAGTGDVLAGMIGGFSLISKNILEGSLLGSFVHGYIADKWVQSGKSDRSLTPSDIVQEMPFYLRILEDEKES